MVKEFQLDIRLFGSPQIVAKGEMLPPFPTQKCRELFAYLAINPNRPISRIMLAGILWLEKTEEKSRASLNTELWRLKQILGRWSDMLILSRDDVQLSLEDANVDVLAFKERFRQTNIESARKCIEIYRGEFLEGCYSEWCILEREQLLDIYLLSLEKLMHYHEMRGQWQDAIIHARGLMLRNSLREELHRKLMKFYVNIGDRSAALAQYQICCTALQIELQAEPMPETRSLFEEIRDAVDTVDSWNTRLKATLQLTRQRLNEFRRSKRYLPDVYVNRDMLSELMVTYRYSTETGLVLLGPSGCGKTTWLIHTAEECIDNGDMVLFMEANSLTLDFDRRLSTQLWGRDTVNTHEAMTILGNEAWKGGKTLWFFIDDVWAFQDLGAGPQDFLRRLDNLIEAYHAQDIVRAGKSNVKIVLTCYEYTWKHIEAGGLKMNWENYHTGQPVLMKDFNDAELKLALKKYSSLNYHVDKFDHLTEETRRMLATPLLLRLASESGLIDSISISGSEGLLYREYFLQKIIKPTTRRFAIELAGWMAENRLHMVDISRIKNDIHFQTSSFDEIQVVFLELVDVGLIQLSENRRREHVSFVHDRFFEYLLAEYMLSEREDEDTFNDKLIDHARRAVDYPYYWGSALLCLLMLNDESLYLYLAENETTEARELCMDGLIMLGSNNPKRSISILQKIMRMESLDAKWVAMKTISAMDGAGNEIFYSAIEGATETIRRLAMVPLDTWWRQNPDRAVNILRALCHDITPMVAILSPNKLQAILLIIGWLCQYDTPPSIFSEMDVLIHQLAVNKLKLPTKASETRLWPIVKYILAQNSIALPVDEKSLAEILKPESLNQEQRASLKRVLSTLRLGKDGLEDVSVEDLRTLLQCDMDAAYYPAHHQLAVWLYFRPQEAARAIQDLFEGLHGHARLWLLFAFVPPSLKPTSLFTSQELFLLEELTTRLSEENGEIFLKGTDRGLLQLLGPVGFLPLGMRYMQSGIRDFPMLSSKLSTYETDPQKLNQAFSLLSPMGWKYPLETLEFLRPFISPQRGIEDKLAQVLGNIRYFHPVIVDEFLNTMGLRKKNTLLIRFSATSKYVTDQARIISRYDVRVSSLILDSAYGRWLTDYVMAGYLEAKPSQQALQGFGDGLFEMLRQCDWHLKCLFAYPD